MIVWATEFGNKGPYTRQMNAAIIAQAPDMRSVNLFAAPPSANVQALVCVLLAYTSHLPNAWVVICVVDSGVGCARRALALQSEGHWYVGSDNSLFEMVVRWGEAPTIVYEITWRPAHLSASFHGRDIFAPVVARVAIGGNLEDSPDFRQVEIESVQRTSQPDDLQEVVYLDHYENAITGLRSDYLSRDEEPQIGRCRAARAMTFSSVSPGAVFCYVNSNGLMEIAVNEWNAGAKFGIHIGEAVTRVPQR